MKTKTSLLIISISILIISCQRKNSDWEKHGLQGNVKSFNIEYYEAFIDNEEWVMGDKGISSDKYLFTDKGQLISQENYNNGDISEKHVFKRIDKDSTSEFHVYNQSNKLISKEISIHLNEKEKLYYVLDSTNTIIEDGIIFLNRKKQLIKMLAHESKKSGHDEYLHIRTWEYNHKNLAINFSNKTILSSGFQEVINFLSRNEVETIKGIKIWIEQFYQEFENIPFIHSENEYLYQEFDDKNNWTKRIIKNYYNESIEPSHVSIETRRLEYY